jgi:hypothetical protein
MNIAAFDPREIRGEILEDSRRIEDLVIEGIKFLQYRVKSMKEAQKLGVQLFNTCPNFVKVAERTILDMLRGRGGFGAVRFRVFRDDYVYPGCCPYCGHCEFS